jgi:hypothetical protein
MHIVYFKIWRAAQIYYIFLILVLILEKKRKIYRKIYRKKIEINIHILAKQVKFKERSL